MSVSALSRDLAWSFWIPVASLFGVEIYASNFDGWGAWATAPLFLIPLVLSLVIAGVGAVRCILECRARSCRLSTVVFTVVAALPILWLLVRRYIVSNQQAHELGLPSCRERSPQGEYVRMAKTTKPRRSHW